MNKDLEELINIGVPCYTPITLPVNEFTLSCAKDKSSSIQIERDIKEETVKRVNDITNFPSSNNHQNLFKNLNYVSNDQSISKIDWLEKQKLIDLFWGLKEFHHDVTEEELLKEVEKQHNLLRDYITYIAKNHYSSEFHDWLKRDLTNLYYGRTYGEDLRHYLNTENTFYTVLETKLEDVLKIDCSDMYETYFDSMHTESVGLFIAYQTLKEVVEALKQGNDKVAQEKAFYLSAYFKRKEFMGLKIIINYRSVSFETLKDYYNHLLEVNPNLKDFNYKRSFFLNHELEENKKVIDTLLNMERIRIKEMFIKQGKTYDTKESSTRVVKPLSKAEEEKVQAYLDYKYYTYLKHHPKAQITCPKKFSNYTAFLFENGMITADRFKGVNRLSETQSDAVYIFDSLNFEKEIQKDKQELIGKVPRIMHRDGWEEKVENIVLKETSEDVKEEGKKLVKKINRF